MKKLLFIFLVLCGLNTFSQRVDSEYKADKISEPELNVVSKKYIGESLILNKEILYKEAILIKNISDFKSYGVQSNLTSGQILPLHHTLKSVKNYLNPYNPATSKGIYFGIAIDTLNNEIHPFYSASVNVWGLDKNTKRSVTAEVEDTIFLKPDCSTCFSIDLLYNGKSGNSIKLTYREFKGDLIRPAFSQELQYDLSEDSIIGFKKMRIEIIKATNTEIEYKVLSHL